RLVDLATGEQCDDGNTVDNDACTNACRLPPIHQIAAGLNHTCALFDSGKVRCWGDGDDGRLGYGNTNNLGAVRCWGGGGSGQLGYGNTNAIGDNAGEMPPPDVDVGGAVTQITAGN